MSEWNIKTSKGKLFWGDARQKVGNIPEQTTFDLIFLDPFSPKQCPELWSEDFLHKLIGKLTHNGRILTYSRAAAIRGSLRRGGLEIKSLSPNSSTSKEWSLGTIGIKGFTKNKHSLWNCLSKMEEEHLLTRAGVPYRDPTGQSISTEILKRRENEQNQCNLKSTNSWRKRWIKTNISPKR
ncbi:MnmC family methyltransferase [Prochlorococcus marinus]|uniref:MnmC family methyltransferase n=1 Tax=Prochlorococcus marinus TaxID=1219 RepID=UPI0022B39B58|nr:MnmC family methyltransferase [Prochlorococcus marinus]